MLTHFKSLSDFLFVNEVNSFFFCSYFDGFRSTARETGIVSTRHSKDQQHGRKQRRPRCCFSPALPSSPAHSAYRPPTKLCPGPAVIIGPVTVAVAAMRQFRWWSVASTGLSWLLISYVCMVCMGSLSSSSLAAILNSWRFLLCELRNLHELNYCKNKLRRLDTKVALSCNQKACCLTVSDNYYAVL